MKYPNAYKGITKIFVSEILETVDHIFYMILLFKGRKMLGGNHSFFKN